jgi:hypothetical protein
MRLLSLFPFNLALVAAKCTGEGRSLHIEHVSPFGSSPEEISRNLIIEVIKNISLVHSSSVPYAHT